MQKKIPEIEQDVQLATLIAQAGQEARNKRKSSLSAHNKKIRDIVEKAAGRLNIKR